MSKSAPNVPAAFQISDEIVKGVLDQTRQGLDLETFDTASMAHLMASVRLMSMRGVQAADLHILVESLSGMILDGEGPTEETDLSHDVKH